MPPIYYWVGQPMRWGSQLSKGLTHWASNPESGLPSRHEAAGSKKIDVWTICDSKIYIYIYIEHRRIVRMSGKCWINTLNIWKKRSWPSYSSLSIQSYRILWIKNLTDFIHLKKFQDIEGCIGAFDRDCCIFNLVSSSFIGIVVIFTLCY